MKLWSSALLEDLPDIIQNGLSDPGHSGVMCSPHAELVADDVMGSDGQSAVLELDIPDAEVDGYFTTCFVVHSDDLSMRRVDLESMIDEGAPQEDIEAMSEELDSAEQVYNNSNSSVDSILEAFGSVCIYTVIPPAWIKVLDPVVMLEALEAARDADNPEILDKAIETTEAKPLSTLGATFWVWLLLFIQGIAQGRLVTPADVRAAAEQIEDREAKRKAGRKKRRRKTRAKQKKAAKKSESAASE
jgi:hypothetical protein